MKEVNYGYLMFAFFFFFRWFFNSLKFFNRGGGGLQGGGGGEGAEIPLDFQVVNFCNFFFICLLKQCCQPTEHNLRCSKTGVVGGGG